MELLNIPNVRSIHSYAKINIFSPIFMVFAFIIISIFVPTNYELSKKTNYTNKIQTSPLVLDNFENKSTPKSDSEPEDIKTLKIMIENAEKLRNEATTLKNHLSLLRDNEKSKSKN